MGKYRKLGTFLNRMFNLDLNANFDDIDADIQVQKARVDNLITGNPQPEEVMDLRVDDEGTIHPTAKDRADKDALSRKAKDAELEASIAQNRQEVDVQLADMVTNVKVFGAKGDGVTNDRQAITDAIAYASAYGYRIIFFPKGSYQLGNLSASEDVFNIQNLLHCTFLGNNAEFLCTTTDQSIPTIFNIDNSAFLKFEGLRLNDSGFDISVNWKGAAFFDLNPVNGIVNNIEFDKIYVNQAVAFLRALSIGTYEAHSIYFKNVRVANAYYGINCVENGNNFNGRIKTQNVKRSYFVYGVEGHDVQIDSSNHPSGDYADLLIKTYKNAATRNLKIRYRAKGTQSTYYALAFEHQHDTGIGIMENIEVDFDDTGNTMGESILFRSYTQAGVKETTTNNRYDNIRIKGQSRKGVFLDVKPNVKGTLEISKGIMDITKSVLTDNWGGCNVVMGYGKFRSVSLGALNTKPISFDLSNFDGKAFMVKVKVWAWNNTAVLGAQETTFTEDIIMGYNVGGSPATILKTQNLTKVFNTTDASITYSISGENLQINFASYTNANGYAIANLEVI